MDEMNVLNAPKKVVDGLTEVFEGLAQMFEGVSDQLELLGADAASEDKRAIDDAEDKVLASVNGENPEWCEMAEQPQEDGDEMESGFLFGSFFVPFSGVMRM